VTRTEEFAPRSGQAEKNWRENRKVNLKGEEKHAAAAPTHSGG